MSFNFEEFNEFLNNYNDPNFRSLFEQFTSTAKSPEEKAIFMTEMKNLQRENLKTDAFVSSKKDSAEKKNKYSNVEYFHGFCVKTNATTYRDYGTISIPVFVNICQSNQIKPAIAKKNCAHGEGHAHHHEKLPKNVQDLPNYWKIPHSPPLRYNSIISNYHNNYLM